MKKSTSGSINHIMRIIKEINVMKESMKTFNIDSTIALKKSELVQRVCTQCITTIEANKRLLDDSVISNLSLFNTINLKRTRDISSHDYGSVDMNIVYRICTKLTDKALLSELKNMLKQLKEIEEKENSTVESGDSDVCDR